MKRIILSAFLSLVAIAQLSAQKEYTTTYQIEYEVTYSLDSLNRDLTDTDKLYLYTGSNYGVFINYNVIQREKVVEKMKRKYGNDVSMGIEYSSSSNNPSFRKTFYKDLQSGEVMTLGKLAKKDYIFKEPKTLSDWQVQDSTKTIKGYTAQKASTHFAGRDYVAWFTLEVPIQDGPYLFSGLPGLIIELYDIKKDYHFKLKSLEKLEKPKIWTIPEGAKTVTKAEFKKLSEQLSKNAVLSSDVHYMMSNTPGIEGSVSTNQNGEVTNSDLKINGRKVSKDELRRAYKKNLESQNNLIELK